MKKEPSKRKSDPLKMHVLRSFPLEIKQTLTKDEVDAFLYDEVWPDSLREKLKDYIIED
ncbi:MAG: hypothetical protein ACUVUQ_02010 [Thermodesulfovibrionales bacterium]